MKSGEEVVVYEDPKTKITVFNGLSIIVYKMTDWGWGLLLMGDIEEFTVFYNILTDLSERHII